MKRNAFGQLIRSPYLRFADGDDDKGGGKEFKPVESQEELDRIVSERARRAEQKAREEERAKFADYEDLKSDAEKFRAVTQPKPKDDDGKSTPLSQADVDKRIEEARAADRLELALERVSDQLDKALDGRTVSASKLFDLDRKQFVNDDGKTVNADALKKWVEENSKEIETPDPRRRPIPGQGQRSGEANGGSVSAGRDLYDETHKKKSGKD
ncbi:hypothetical protein CSIV_04975 [Microbacterium sp. CSI-V]|uniref:hypothetical protein n=1 Tax=Microbacterium sp. CSI-V TaxID=1933777 RepID=UPI00097C5206|nr:hypothetical protein [Microbacterium sp. CSI-V]ONI65635.1 hypothetical protein CSIV_04975 [Microbacterium sp. CSI-V]